MECEGGIYFTGSAAGGDWAQRSNRVGRFTNNGARVQDLYIETFNPVQPDEYKVNGKWGEGAD